MKKELVDSFSRRINYLRISLTDLCNFKCVYCVPSEGYQAKSPARYLTRHQIVRFVRIAADWGIERLRLTGGEPLLRPDILEIIQDLKSVSGIRDVSITTNGSRLHPMLPALKKAGLDRINVSLDSIEPGRFQRITDVDVCREVIEAIFEALRVGFPVKVNMVVMRGLTKEEIIRFVGLAHDHPLEVRFLEFMPLCGRGWSENMFVPICEIRSIVQEFFQMEKLPREGEVAESYRLKGGKGRVGFIASLTESFCDQCSRIRISSEGEIQPCLFSPQTISVGNLLRQDAPDEVIVQALQRAAKIKPRGNVYHGNPFGTVEEETVFLPGALIRSIGG